MTIILESLPVTPTETPTASAPESTQIPVTTPPESTPVFEAVFAIAGLLAVAYLLRRRK
jgi:PGF-CTERM protein